MHNGIFAVPLLVLGGLTFFWGLKGTTGLREFVCLAGALLFAGGLLIVSGN